MTPEVAWLIVLGVMLLSCLLSGLPVILVLAGVPLFVASLAAVFGHFDPIFLQAFPQRVEGIMTNSLLLSIPLFVLMGVILEQSKQAEIMLRSIAAVFGGTKSALVLSVLFVSVLIAASTGIIGATILMLGMIGLPILLKSGVSARMSSGLICAAGTLGQIIPPSIVLILLGDQISNAYLEAQQAAGNFAPRQVTIGDLFAGAIIPGLLLVALYAAYCLTVFAFQGRRATVEEKEQQLAAELLAQSDWNEDGSTPSLWQLFVAIFPTILLMFGVLGSILFGVATPTESAAIGVAGTILIATANLNASNRGARMVVGGIAIALILLVALRFGGFVRTVDLAGNSSHLSIGLPAIILAGIVGFGLLYCCKMLWSAGELLGSLQKTVVISAMIFGIVVAASMLSLVFRGFGGDDIIVGLLDTLPGGAWGLLICTMLLVFVLGFVLEFIEIIFIVIPVVGPVLFQFDFDPVWFAILIALNVQTSFLTPPFGFALFYYRSVAPSSISTKEIYISVAPFIALQLVAIGFVMAFPALATWLPSLLGNAF